MRLHFLALCLLIGLCPAVEASEDSTWKGLLDRAELLAGEGRIDSANVVVDEALSVALTAYGPSDTTVMTKSYAEGIWTFSYFRSYAEAESLYTRVLAVQENTYGRDHSRVLMTLLNLADIYGRQDRDTEAEALYVEALGIAETNFGPGHPSVGNTLCALASTAWARSDFSRAESLYVRGLLILEEYLGPNHLNLGSGLNNLGVIYSYLEREPEAERLLKRAVGIWEANLMPEHPYLANSLLGLASVQEDLGKFAEVEAMYLRALDIYERAYGPEHINVAGTVQNLGFHYILQARFADAERMLRRSLAIFEATSGPEHPNVAYTLITLQTVCGVYGRDAEGAECLKRALTIWENSVGPDNPGLGVGLSSLAAVYMNQGNYSGAEELLKRALAIDEKAFGPAHHRVAGDLQSLAQLYHDIGKDTEAESLYMRALAINEDVYGPEHRFTAMILHSYAALYMDQGRLREAESLYRRYLATCENTYGAMSMFTSPPLNGIAEIRRREHAFSEAVELAERSWRIMWGDLTDNSAVVSERDALKYSRLFRQSFNRYASCLFDLQEEGLQPPEESAEIVLSSKGAVADAMLRRQRAMSVEEDSTTIALIESLRYTKFRYSNLITRGPQGDPEEFRSQLDSLNRYTRSLESDLAYRSTEFKREQELKRIEVERIASLLPEESALIEYFQFDLHQLEPEADIPHYAALVVVQGDEPKIIQIGEAQAVNDLVNEYREHMIAISRSRREPAKANLTEYVSLGMRLYDLLVLPVADLLDDKALLFIAPDGALNMISFSGLIDSTGSYLIERHAVHYLSSGRDHLRFNYSTDTGTGLLALGDPDFDADVMTRVGKHPTEPGGDVTYSLTRSIRSGCGELSDIRVDPLPGSRKEIELVTAAWKKRFDEPLWTYLGHDASEEALKAHASGKRVLHLATHGYYLEGRCLHGAGSGTDADRAGENPLLLSGLFLAGANLHGKGADSLGAEDGILTAYEVSAMDLGGIELVVLSACETGLGKVEEGEGVYGLRRAFQMAGARTVVSALWPVPDDATADMMSQLYERQDESIPETMHRIQLYKIRELRENGQPDHPYIWAGFIALGDWR